MPCSPKRKKPGAEFAFKPRDTLRSSAPDFSSLLSSATLLTTVAINTDTTTLHTKPAGFTIFEDIAAGRTPDMGSERTPSRAKPAVHSMPSPIAPSPASHRRGASPDSDEDIGALLSQKGWDSAAPVIADDDSVVASPQSSETSTGAPQRSQPQKEEDFWKNPPKGPASWAKTSGQPPPKLLAARKPKGDPFIRQRTRPEHHLGAANPNATNRIHVPKGPVYHDKKPAPLPKFDSNFFTGDSSSVYGAGSQKKTSNVFAGGIGAKYDKEVFYTDPEKAQADLKDLLEGGMGEDDEEELDERDQIQKIEKPAVEETAEKKPAVAAVVDQKPELKVVQQDPQATRDQDLHGEAKRNVRKDGTVDGLKVKLLPHQVAGVRWMRGRELGPVKQGKVPKGGILADDMGLGKTLQTVSLMLTNPKPAKVDDSYKPSYERLEKTTLVVAPLALIRQWEAELRGKVEKRHGLKVLVHHGPQRTKSYKDLALYDVVITTYQILVSEHAATSDKPDGVKAGCFGLHWWRVVLDEAHSIKNRNAKMTKACYALRSEFRWCLSGTPMQNNLDELQSLVKFLRIKPYDDYREWKDHIDTPLKNGRGHIAIQRIHSLLHCFMKRRTKEILKKDGALNPGGAKTEPGEQSSTGFRVTERKVVTVAIELSTAERKFYDRVEERANGNIRHMMNNKVNYASAFTLLLRLRQACNHPKLLEGKLDRDKDAWSGSDPAGKGGGADVDAMVDMFAGMKVEMKNCTICASQLPRDKAQNGDSHCEDCVGDLEYFHHPEKEKKDKAERRKKKKSKKDQVVKIEKKLKVEKAAARRPRNRNAVVDSDDEEEGSWLVSENERGNTNLGKAGGSEDENAEGGGDSILTEERSDIGDDRDLSGFVVDDEATSKEKGYKFVGGEEEDDSDGSLISISALTQKLASQTLDENPPSPTVSDPSLLEQDGSGSEVDSEFDSDDSVSDSELYDSDHSFATGGRGAASDLLASAKIRKLIDILNKEVRNHKFIVFSQFTSMLDLVEPFLHRRNFKFTRYDGSMKNDEREESLKQLRENKKCRVLLCSLKCGSLGLNLTAATRVIILEPFWNPFVEEQAIDRVHRLTQTVDVVVYRITAVDTVEQKILDLQERKRLLAEHAIEGAAMASDKKGGMNLDLNELLALFRPGAARADGEGNGEYQEKYDSQGLTRRS